MDRRRRDRVSVTAAVVAFVLFTLTPLSVLAVALGYSSIRLYDSGTVRSVPLLALLALMAVHQMTEVGQFVSGGYGQSISPTAELVESAANVLAGVGSYFVLQQIDELRTTRADLAASNGLLTERSAMASVLNRVLRHNVRNEVNVVAGRVANASAAVDDGPVRRELEIAEERALALARISERTSRIGRLLDDDGSDLIELDIVDSLERSLARLDTDGRDATVGFRAGDSTVAVVSVPSSLPLMVADVVEEILVYNDGSVAVEVTIAPVDTTADGEPERVQIAIRDDADGLPETDLHVLDNDAELPLEHAEGLSLWCLKWAVERSEGTVSAKRDGPTITIRLPRPDAG